MFDRNEAREDEIRRALLGRVLAESMDDTANVAAYHAAVARYPATVLLCAYMTARSVPPQLIRRSRGAYFTFLLQKLCPHPSQGASSASLPADATPASPPSAGTSTFGDSR
jgi:hypothetical protein